MMHQSQPSTIAREAGMKYTTRRRSLESGQGLVEYAVILIFVAIVLIGFAGCSSIKKYLVPIPPYAPRIYYEDIKNVVIQPVGVNSVKRLAGPIFAPDTKVAIYNFDSPKDTQGGILVSDVFAAHLRARGFQVYERDEIDRILSEQALISQGKVAVNDLEIAEKLGTLIPVNYMVFGAVTLYRSDGQTIFLPVYIVEDDKASYMAEYEEFRDYYVNGFRPLSAEYWTLTSSERGEKLRTSLKILSLEELEEELAKAYTTEYRTIASIGVSAKIVDTVTGEIVWMGQAETTDFTLVDGASRIIDEFIRSILEY